MADQNLLKLYVPVQQEIFNRWMVVIGTSPALVLLFVNERTLRWGKLWEYVPQRHFLKGLSDSRGNQIHSGLPIGSTVLWGALGRLQKEGWLGTIRAEGKGYGTQYCLNVSRILQPLVVQTKAKNAPTYPESG